MDPRTLIREQLDMSEGAKRQLNLRNRRVHVNSNSFSLVIGLGGTGLQALIEIKGLIHLTCEGVNKNVAFLAFDYG